MKARATLRFTADPVFGPNTRQLTRKLRLILYNTDGATPLHVFDDRRKINHVRAQ
jgi:hypothetical protein